MKRWLSAAVLGAALAGCASPDACDFPADATTAAGVVTEADTCGYWALALDDHLYLDLHVNRELPDCALSLGEGVDLPNDPIYTALNNDSPKYTYDFVGASAVDLTTIDIACDEGTEWHAQVEVSGG